jgi:putative intracellular protease/amidase
LDDLCIHELHRPTCSICQGTASTTDPKAVAGGLKAAASRAGRVALPSKRFSEEVGAAVAELQSAGEEVTVSAVQRILRAAGYEAGRKPTTAAMRSRGLLS